MIFPWPGHPRWTALALDEPAGLTPHAFTKALCLRAQLLRPCP